MTKLALVLPAALLGLLLLATLPAAAETDEALMKAGLDALYAQNDPEAAAVQFRQVLARNPTHYGATFQLAMALDRAGKPAEALPLWERVLRMASGYNDRATTATASVRLAAIADETTM
jgi:cytochrome c-type biogenesis protein CcmH/NrfG